MRWRGRRQSSNVRDRRSSGGGGGGRGIAIGGGGGLIVLGIIIAVWLLGGDPTALISQVDPGVGTPQSRAPATPEEEALADFVGVVLADTEDVWNLLFAEGGRDYREPQLVLFRDATRSGCGFAEAAIGPFYCPLDSTVYLDLGFFEQLSGDLGAPGDFAQAYVIAHEVGHHIQNLLGTMDEVQRQRGRLSEAEYNELSVRLELQADFYAGVWAHYAQAMANILEPGDIEEAIRAAGAVGDDRLQRRSQGYIVPDSFTHGTSAQRIRWFRLGFETGDLSAGDTLNARDL